MLHVKEEVKFEKLLCLDYYHSDNTKQDNGLLIFLHGSGDCYNNKKETEQFLKYYYEFIKDISENIVVCVPICCAGKIWEPDDMKVIIDTMINKYQLNKNRVYIIGHSMGARGVWSTICHYPDLFSAAVPISGYSYYLLAKHAVNIPIWCFHGTEDTVVPIEESIKMVFAIKNHDGNLIKFSKLQGIGHNESGYVIFNKEVYKWMFNNVK